MNHVGRRAAWAQLLATVIDSRVDVASARAWVMPATPDPRPRYWRAVSRAAQPPSGQDPAVELHELGPGDPRLPEVLAVMRQLRVDRSIEDLERLLAEGSERSGYRLVALFDGGACRAVAGFRVLTSFAHGRYLYIDDLVTDAGSRSKGHGERLEAHLAELARAEGCEGIRLDSGVARRRAHRFYFRRGYAIESFNFGRRLDAERDRRGSA